MRSWRGSTSSKKTKLPNQPLQLFDQEAHPACRLVREAITELNLDTMIYPVPENGTRHRDRLKELSGDTTIPFLYDPNSGQKLTGIDAIVSYLFGQYRGTDAPAALLGSTRNLASSRLASKVRFGAGRCARPSTPPESYLTLYSFESSPYSRLARETLCELEIPYLLVNLGKQQRQDMGPAKMRLTLKPYKPLPGTKRDDFFRKHGDVMVPFLEDPNTKIEMFESAEIVNYLHKQYALKS
jgi:glutathione S-transferase